MEPLIFTSPVWTESSLTVSPSPPMGKRAAGRFQRGRERVVGDDGQNARRCKTLAVLYYNTVRRLPSLVRPPGRPD